jgi:Tol biopolymer transport system component
MKRNSMKKSVLLVVLWLLAGCAGAIVTSPTAPASPDATATLPSQPTAAATATQALPVTWGGHGLSGHLLLIQYHETGDSLIELDLQSGEISVLFQAPNSSKLLAGVLSPDGKQIVLAYAAPTPGQIQLGNTDLYLLPVGSTDTPKLLAKRSDTDESYFGPVWAADSKTILYAHFFKTLVNNTPVYQYGIETIDLTGKALPLIPDAFWPAISPDGTQVAYVYSDPKGISNDLYIADSSGNNKRVLTTPNVTPPVDAHFFSEDGKTVFFSMVNPQTQPASNWWDNLFGVRTVSAHNVPSDWYKVPAAGGKIERVTNVNDTGLSGTMSPDGSRLAFISMNGLFSVKPDGSDLIKLSNDTFEGSIQWIP